MNKKVVLLAFVLLSLCLVGLLRLQIAYASPYTDISVATAYDMITNGSYPDLVVLDVRRQDEYDSGHIYGAVWIPHTQLEARIGELADHENHEIIAYCKSGFRSQLASQTLDSHNFTKVYNMLGGITAWQSAGYPLWIAIPGEVNGDGIVNIVDGVIIGVAFGSRPGDPNWNPIADIAPVGAPDNYISIQDIVLMAIHFGETA